MRIAPADPLRLGQAHQAEQLNDAPPGAAVPRAAMPPEDLRDLFAHAHAGAERGGRVLRDQADPVAPQGVQRRPLEAQEIHTLEENPAALDPAARASITK